MKFSSPHWALLGALLLGCSGGENAEVNNPPPAILPSATIPATVPGYTGCNSTPCADAARACDDYLRSGCAPLSWSFWEKPVPGSQRWKDALGGCAAALMTTFHEKMSEEEGEQEKGKTKKPSKEQESAQFLRLVNMTATCTRHVKNCAQMGECFRGIYFPKVWGTSSAPIVQPPKPVDIVSWTIPYDGTGPDPLSDTPWGQPATLTVQDSPSCAACAIERCPTFAFLCFGAEGTTDCPNGDCCESLRSCVSRCGGYEPRAAISAFDNCVAFCSTDKPHAVQQLADLQHCGDVACKGCAKFDSKLLQEEPQ